MNVVQSSGDPYTSFYICINKSTYIKMVLNPIHLNIISTVNNAGQVSASDCKSFKKPMFVAIIIKGPLYTMC